MSVLVPIVLGTRFCELVVVAQIPNRAWWRCRCDCGREVVVSGYSLRFGGQKSCGHRKRSHGEASRATRTTEYKAWTSLRERCLNPAHADYANYGGRGIRVCPQWDRYENFLADMGRRPSPRHSIDRIDNADDYKPENCRWATSDEQNNNQRRNHRITFAGKTQTMAQWAAEIGIQVGTLSHRLNMRGWTPERALMTPVQTRFRNRPAAQVALVLILAVSLLLAPTAAAEPPEGVVMEHDGKAGLWLPLEAHRAILADLRELPERRAEVHLLDEKLRLRVEQVSDLRIAAAAATEAQKVAVAALDAAEKGRAAAENRLDAWYRSPTLWIAIGVVAGLGLTLGAAKLAQAN